MIASVRFLILAASFSLFKVILEPREFLTLVVRKFAPGCVFRGERIPLTRVQRLINFGDISSAKALVNHKKGLNSVFARRGIDHVLEQLNLSILSSLPLRENDPSSVRVYSLHTNSVPYTQSGYTIRSLRIMEALDEAGIANRAATRLGYPTVIGSRLDSEKEGEVGNRFDRLLPIIYPWSHKEYVGRAAELLAEQAREFNATVLHTTTDYKNAQVVSRAAHMLGIPWVYEVRGEPEKTWLSKFPKADQDNVRRSKRFNRTRQKETEAMLAASAVVVLSKVSRDTLIERGVPKTKIVVIPNAVEHAQTTMPYDRDKLRAELGLSSTRPLVGAITSVVDYEGLDSLLDAAASSEKFDVVVVGGGAVLPELKQRASDLELSGRVRFVGYVPQDEVWKWYAALDVFAVPRKDTEVCRTVTPLKPLMALALGIPVVASDLPALREVTGGHLIAHTPEDAPSLIDAIHCALEVGVETKRRYRAWAKSRTWEKNAERYRSLFSGIKVVD